MNGQPDTATAIAALDQAMKALVLAKSALLGEGSAALFISAQDLAAAETSPGNPYGSTKHGEFTAGSAAEVAEGVGPALCNTRTVEGSITFICVLANSHEGPHQSAGKPSFMWPQESQIPESVAQHLRDLVTDHEGEIWACSDQVMPAGPDLCPAQWGEPPETMLCSLASGHDGNHATAEGIEWGGRWETAEPKGEPPLSKPWRLDLHVCGVRFELSAPPDCPDALAHHATAEFGTKDGAR